MNNRSEALSVSSPETELLCSQECKIHYSGKAAGKQVLDCSHRDTPEKETSPALSLLLWNSNTSHLVLIGTKKGKKPWKTVLSKSPKLPIPMPFPLRTCVFIHYFLHLEFPLLISETFKFRKSYPLRVPGGFSLGKVSLTQVWSLKVREV